MLISQLISHADWLSAQVAALDTAKQVRFYFSNFFLLTYSTTGYQLLAPAWSLDIEFQFYILFPLIAHLAGLNRKWLLYLTPLVFLVALYGNVNGVFWITQTLAKYLFLFMLGMLAFYYQLKPNKTLERIANVALVIVILSQYLIPGLGQYYRVEHSPYYEALTFVMLILAIPLLLRSVHTETTERDRFWGEMSFLIYLVHGVFLVPYNLLIDGMAKSHRLPYVLCFLLATLGTAWLLYTFVDRPSEIKRQRWVKNQAMSSFRPIL
jgi:peptidoglycan/LPS O-acetylase OafA/YrhL